MARPRKIDQMRQPAGDSLCVDQIVHVDAVRETRAALPDQATVAGVSTLFAALGDPTRLRLIAALAVRELCVCDLAASLGLSQSAVSHQLSGLRRQGLVLARRVGRLVYYSLDDEHVSHLYSQALDHVRHQTKEPV